jgi:hypothetical protein
LVRQDLIDQRVAKLISGFSRYVRAYDDDVPFTGKRLAAHRETIALRREAGSVRAAIASEQYLVSLRRTLRAWGIGVRASKLVSETDFAAALQAVVPYLEPLEGLTINDVEDADEFAGQLWPLIESLGVVTNKAKLVAGTKTLHHLLPELVPPMDRGWTGFFFQFHLPEWQDPQKQRGILELAYHQFAAVARQTRPEQYASGTGWRTSRTKILDNALIGFCKVELGTSSSDTDELVFEVSGYPPAKDGAKSVLSQGHLHGPRVQALLAAARGAYAAQEWTPTEHGPISLDVVLYAPEGANRADSTNYLGGIADVLEDKLPRSGLDHLGSLGEVWLYRNDRQIKAITYREELAAEPSYTVSIRALGR